MKINYKTKQLLTNFQPPFSNIHNHLQAEMRNGVAYKTKNVYCERRWRCPKNFWGLIKLSQMMLTCSREEADFMSPPSRLFIAFRSKHGIICFLPENQSTTHGRFLRELIFSFVSFIRALLGKGRRVISEME